MTSEKIKESGEDQVSLAEKVRENELKKEEKLVDLIIKIIVRATLEEHYETCHTLPEVQPNRTE